MLVSKGGVGDRTVVAAPKDATPTIQDHCAQAVLAVPLGGFSDGDSVHLLYYSLGEGSIIQIPQHRARNLSGIAFVTPYEIRT